MPIVKVRPQSWLPKGDALVDAEYPLVVVGGIPGEKEVVDVKVEGPRSATGQFLESPEPDPRRVTPSCEKIGYCGQCALMHIRPDAQGQIRAELVRDAFYREGLGSVPVAEEEPVGIPDMDSRYLVKLGFESSDRGRTRVGIWSRHSPQVVAVPQCPVVTPTIRKVMMSLAHHAIEMDLRPWDPVTDYGLLRRALVRESRETGEVMLTLVVSKRNRTVVDYAERVATGVSEITAVWVHVNEGPANEIFQHGDEGMEDVFRMLGKESITERFGEVLAEIGAEDTVGFNPVVTAAVQSRLITRLELGEGDAFVHLRSGTGALVTRAAAVASLSIGVEPSERAVVRSHLTAKRAGVVAGFVHGEIDESIDEVKRRLGEVRPAMVLELHGRGPSEEMMEAVEELRPRRIGVVAHNPRALASSLKRWLDRYQIEGEVEVFGPAPHTAMTTVFAILQDPTAPRQKVRAARRKVVRKR
ncbi:MAG: hypothetical protein JXX28_11005 [Deltaproteobacteria bacterium]|nr:hypothetical protein [Deltaproteobacteria bacterium]